MILLEVARSVCPDLVPSSGFPPIFVIDNATSAWKGMADLVRVPTKKRTTKGYDIRYRQTSLALDRQLLSRERFGEAVATFLHELAHTCGGERTVAFSSVLTDLIGQAADASGDLLRAKQRWRDL